MTDYEVTPPPDRLADRVQIRTAVTTEHGEVVRFMTQLEYWLNGEWQPVVWYDHDREAEGGHDVTEEGLYRDVYRDGEKIRSEDVTGPIPAAISFKKILKTISVERATGACHSHTCRGWVWKRTRLQRRC